MDQGSSNSIYHEIMSIKQITEFIINYSSATSMRGCIAVLEYDKLTHSDSLACVLHRLMSTRNLFT